MIEKIFKKLEDAKKILIITHPNPDGDTLGSACALKDYLGDKADILLQLMKGKTYPETYAFLPFLDSAKSLENVQHIYDTVVCVDVASIDRIVEGGREIFNKAKVRINIDHHKTNVGFADLNHIKGDVSSTGEILFEMFEQQNIQISSTMAKCLYTSIMCDTGSFRYENVSSNTFAIASKLAKLDINTSEIAQNYYDNKPKEMVLFQAYCVNNAKLMYSDKVIYSIITDDDLKKFNAKLEHTEGISETLRSIYGVEVAFIIKKVNEGTQKVSMRSKKVDITKIVSKWQGGGHSKAAGCTIRKPLNIALEELLTEVKKHI